MNKISLVFSSKNIGFHFGLGFMGELLDGLDCSIDELMRGIEKNPFKYVPRLMFEAHSYDCLRNEKENKHSLIVFTDLLDANGGVMSDNVSKFLQAFTQSITKDVPTEKVLKAVGKKKASPKK